MSANILKLREKALNLVEKPGVYLMKDKQNKIIYIGKAKSLKNRVVSYFRSSKSHNDKVLKMVSLVEDFDYIITDSEFEALVLECSLIKQYAPKYNILLKDDKGYRYIKVTKDNYPRIRTAKQKIDDDSRYIGPFVSAFTVSQSVDEVNKIFLLPTCNRKFPAEFNKARPCLNFYIKNCMGVCKGGVSQAEYENIIIQAISYLDDGSELTQTKLISEMEKAAENLDFEKAARIRDRISAITKLGESQKVLYTNRKENDFIGVQLLNSTAVIVVLKYKNGNLYDKLTHTFYDVYDKNELLNEFLLQYYQDSNIIPTQIYIDSEIEDVELLCQYFTEIKGKKVSMLLPQKGDSKKTLLMAQNNALEELSRIINKKSREVVALSELQQLLGLASPPEYIESYDISNLKDSHIVGGMVVFKNGLPYKNAYKKFSMKENLTQDDYACMREMISRRFTRYLDEDEKNEGFKTLPDLILLDGGSNHVSVVKPILRELKLNIPIFGMVKDSRHRTRAIAYDGKEIQISTFKSAFRLITQIQDEVHRYSIAFQKQKHKKHTFAMGLTDVPKIGPKKAQALLKQFKTKKALKEASAHEVKAIVKCDDDTIAKLMEAIKNI